MPRTLGAEMPTATPTEKNYTDIYQTCFEKNCYEHVLRMICIALVVVKLGLGFGIESFIQNL